MSKVTIDQYFELCRQLTPVVDLKSVKSIVVNKGAVAPKPKLIKWNLNSIIMTSTIVIISSALLINHMQGVQQSENYAEMNPVLEVNNNENGSGKTLASMHASDSIFTNEKDKLIQEERIEVNYNVDSSVESELEMMTLINDSIFESDRDSNQKFSTMGGYDVFNVNNPIVDEIEIPVVNNVSTIPIEQIETTIPIEQVNVSVPQTSMEANESNQYDFNDSYQAMIEGSSKTVQNEISAEGIEWLELASRNGNIEFKNWENNSIKVVAVVEMEGNNEEDELKALEKFELELQKTGNRLEIKHNYEEYNFCNVKVWPRKKKKKVKIEEGEEVKLKRMGVNYQLFIPKELNLELKNNYGNISIDALNGDLNASLFKGDIYAGNIAGEIDLSEKYGRATIKSMQKGEIYLFQSNADIGSSIELSMEAKYSKVDIQKVGNMSLSGFQSNIEIAEEVEKIDGSVKYGKLELEDNAKELDLSFFQGKLFSQNVDQLNLNASYTNIEVGDVNKLNLSKGFQCNIKAKKVGEFEGSLKYTPLKMSALSDKMVVYAFQGSVSIDAIEASFERMDLDIKYTNLNLEFAKDASYKVDAKTRYTGIKFPEDKFDLTKEIKNYSNRDFIGEYNTSSSDPQSVVNITAFQGSISMQ